MKKGKNKPKGNPGQGGNNRERPSQSQAGWNSNRNKNQEWSNPQRQNNRANLWTNHSCLICGEYDHYTHHCPDLPELKNIQANRGQGGSSQYTSVIEEPFPHQGTITTQQQTPDNYGKNSHEIYMTGEDFFFQTRNRNYDTPLDTNSSGASTSAPTTPLTISNMPIEPFPKMAKGPTRREGNHSKAAHNYSIIDDLAQSPSTMSALEVLQSCPK